jgi:hypothetical protein
VTQHDGASPGESDRERERKKERKNERERERILTIIQVKAWYIT